MKKLKKTLALTLGASMTVSMAGSLQADALGAFTAETAIEGFELVDLSSISPGHWNGSYYGKELFYWDKETHHTLRVLYSPCYNSLSISVENKEDILAKWQEIYSKYEKELNFEYSNEMEYGDSFYMTFFDRHDADGNETFDADSMPDKSEIIEKLTEELYDAGVTRQVEYRKVSITMQSGNFYDTSAFVVKCPPLCCYDMAQISLLAGGAKLNITEATGDPEVVGDDQVREFRVENIANSTEFVEIAAAIKDYCPECEITSTEESSGFVVLASSSENLYSSVNLLDPYICDINGDGKADTADAAQILASYAENASGILKAAESDSMDVNGDGAVDTQDATYVLAYYAEAAAGLR